jgi:ABC-type transport system involved in Fe-S cluster assembly fused permease/ATPase subunit
MNEQHEYEIIKELLEHCGNKARAALRLQCSRRTVDRHIAGYKMERKTYFTHENRSRQRIAIARGYFRDHELIVLDEPTSAINPYEESLLFQKFAEISKDKTALIVTHRMGSVKIADRIVVLKAGKYLNRGHLLN